MRAPVSLCVNLARAVGVILPDAVSATFLMAPPEEAIADSVEASAAAGGAWSPWVFWSPREELVWQCGRAGVLECRRAGDDDIIVRVDTVDARR